ncbi:MAG: class I SAM-dependent methyltransferase [Acidimicrobiales bacterium]
MVDIGDLPGQKQRVALQSEVDQLPWYHTIALPGGVVTRGEYDHRGLAARLPLPQSMAGMRCLDIGTHDGYWAFEMERRGASEVIAIDVQYAEDLDWPEPRPPIDDDLRAFLVQRKQAFVVARDALGSKVERRYLSVYNLSPEVVGEFDFVFLGTLLHHLRDPMGALMAIRRVTRGRFLLVGTFSVSTTLVFPKMPLTTIMDVPGAPFWELPNVSGMSQQLRRSGWTILERSTLHLQRYGEGFTRPRLSVRPVRTLARRTLLRYGAPHIAILAEPAGRCFQKD